MCSYWVFLGCTCLSTSQLASWIPSVRKMACKGIVGLGMPLRTGHAVDNRGLWLCGMHVLHVIHSCEFIIVK